MKRRTSTAFTASLFAFLMAGSTPLSAQLASDEVPHQRTISQRDEVRHQLEESRYLGPVGIRPLLSLRDLGYDNNVFGATENPVGDWRATIGAGARYILPVGQKIYVRGRLLPEYTWYQKVTQFRTFGGHYDASVLGLFNRLPVEAGVRTFRGNEAINSEQEGTALGKRTNLFVRGELEVLPRLSFFGSGEEQRQRYSPTSREGGQQLPLQQLSRNETVVRSGVRYRFASYLDFSTAVERTQTRFLSANERDNRSNAIIFGVHYDRPRSFLNLSVGSRKGHAERGTVFPGYQTVTGSYFASHRLGAPITIDLYGHRGVVFGLYQDNPYYLETRQGFALTFPIGLRFAARTFVELGKNTYPLIPSGETSKRTDDALTGGGAIAIKLYRKIVATIGASNTRYTSNLAQFDRSVFRLSTFLSFTGDFFQ